MKIKSNYTDLTDYIFWTLFIIYTNPGAILEAIFNEDRGDGGINLVDFVFVLMFICYMFVFHKKDGTYFKKDRIYSKVLMYLIIFVLYLFLVFGLFVPIFKSTPDFSFLTVFVKSRTTIFNLFLFIMVYRFFMRSNMIFLKLFLYSSITIILLFFVSIFTGADLIPIERANRGFVNIDRIFMKEYGIMPLLIPMGVVIITFKNTIKFKNLILIGSGLMFVVWLVSLTRRHIFGSLIILVFSLMFYNYFQRKALLPFSKLLSITIYLSIMGVFLFFTFPKYIDAGIKAVDQTIYVLVNGETETGRKDERFGFDRKFIVDIFKENPIFGTGFDNRWRTGAGGKSGYEAADYPFLAALAMTGLTGIIVFLPLYIILCTILFRDVQYFRTKYIDYRSREFFYVMIFLLYFSFSLIQYMNWFRPISNQPNYEFHIYLAMYLASRKLFFYSNSNNRRNKIKFKSHIFS